MKKGLIITLPRHDEVTEYLSFFSKDIIDEAKNRHIPVKKLIDKDANKENFEKNVKKTDFKLFVLNGHGAPTIISGYKNKLLIGEGINEEILLERITYARSCDAGYSLGKKAMQKNKEGCFIGYKLSFQFYSDETWHGNPAKDLLAPLFLEPSNLIPISILKGKPTGEAHLSSKKAILKNIKKVLKKSNYESLVMAEALWNNYEGLVLIGNSSAEI